MKYKRILLKISGEALLGEQQFGIDQNPVKMIANEIKKVRDMGAEVAVVVGGGNIFRGMKNSAKLGMDQASGDYVGMLATVMNAIALQSALNQINVDCRVQSAIAMNQIAEPYIRHRAIRHLEKGRVVIFGCGTGNPFFTTDTASVVRALEINCDAVLKATKVDGIYSADPFKDPDAIRYTEISFDEAIEKRLKVMDASAFSLCRDNNLAIIVFDFAAEESLERVVSGDTSCGTIVS